MGEPGPSAAAPRTVSVIALGACAACALAVLVVRAVGRELWLDEYYTALLADMPLAEMFRHLLGDVHPPVYYVSVNLWRRVFGDSPLAFRAFSMLFHLLGGMAFLFVARAIFERWSIAAIGAALFLLSPALLFHGAEARMYSMSLLLVTVAIGLLWRQCTGRSATREAIVLGGVCALAFYTHYVTVPLIAVLFLFWLLVQVRERTGWRPLLAGGLTFGLLTAPWLPVLLRQMRLKRALSEAVQISWSDPASVARGAQAEATLEVPNRLAELALNGISLTGMYPADDPLLLLLAAVPFVVVLGMAAWRTLRGDMRGILVVAAVLANAVACLILGVLSRRYQLNLTPLLIVFLCIGLTVAYDRSPKRLHPALAGLLVLLTFAGAVRVAATDDDAGMGPIIETIRNDHRPGDVVVFNALHGQVIFDYQARRIGFDPERRGFPETVYDWWDRQPSKGWGGPVILESDLQAFLDRLELESVQRVWLLQFETRYYDPRERLRQAFGERGWRARTCARQPDSPYALFLVAADSADAECPAGTQ